MNLCPWRSTTAVRWLYQEINGHISTIIPYIDVYFKLTHKSPFMNRCAATYRRKHSIGSAENTELLQGGRRVIGPLQNCCSYYPLPSNHIPLDLLLWIKTFWNPERSNKMWLQIYHSVANNVSLEHETFIQHALDLWNQVESTFNAIFLKLQSSFLQLNKWISYQ